MLSLTFLSKMLYNMLVMSNIDASEIILNRIVAINTIAKNDHRVVTRNDRSTYALTMKIAGRTIYVCSGERFVSDVNNMLLVDKNARYQWHMDEKGKCVMIEFEGNVGSEPFGFIDFTLTDTAAQEVSALFVSAANLWDMKKDNYMLKCKSIFYRILDKATAHKKQSYLPSSYKHMLEPVVNYIHANYGDPDITNDTLASITGISTVYFRKIFTKAFNVSPIKYLRSVRIKKATELLIGDGSSVSEIAEATGYGSLYNFSKMFKLETGVSPREYAATYSTRKESIGE